MTGRFTKNSRIYVAGHTGMLGSAFMRRLTADGYSNVITASSASLDLTRQQDVETFFSEVKPALVILAAGRVGGIIENRDHPGDFITDNLQLQVNVLSAARQHAVQGLVFFASSCMYPRECPQPMSEDMLLTGVPEPTSRAYALAKLAGVQTCLAYNAQMAETRYLPLIPNTMYGPGDCFDLDKSHVLPALICRFHEAKIAKLPQVVLWGSGKPRREFIYVDDVVDAAMHLLQHTQGELELPVNIGTGHDCTIAELAEVIRDVVGYSGQIIWDTGKPDGAPRKLLDSARLARYGWQTTSKLREGIARTYQWYLAHQGAAND